MMEGLRKPTELIVVVISLLAYGCPLQAIVHADRDWMNEPWRVGEIEPGITASCCIRPWWSKRPWTWCMSKLMRSASKDGA